MPLCTMVKTLLFSWQKPFLRRTERRLFCSSLNTGVTVLQPGRAHHLLPLPKKTKGFIHEKSSKSPSIYTSC